MIHHQANAGAVYQRAVEVVRAGVMVDPVPCCSGISVPEGSGSSRRPRAKAAAGLRCSGISMPEGSRSLCQSGLDRLVAVAAVFTPLDTAAVSQPAYLVKIGQTLLAESR